MTISTERQTFRALVADVAARAKARLPVAVNGRVESAARLVLLHDVEVQADGSIIVGSSSDPMKTYTLTGTSCTCQDFAHGKGIEGWCQHRIAAGIDKRVRELLPVVPEIVEPWADNDIEEPLPEPTPPPAPAPLPEAPASVNVRVVIGGREVQWTLRDSDEARLAGRLEALLARYPAPQAQPPAASQGQLSPQQFGALAQHKAITGVCPVHQVSMTWNEANGRGKGWFSHRTDDGWCKGK